MENIVVFVELIKGTKNVTKEPVSSPTDGSNENGNADSRPIPGSVLPEGCSNCPGKPADADCTEYSNGCCKGYICGDLIRNCTDEKGKVYAINESWKPNKCKICDCYATSTGASSSCYNDFYCYRPHEDCISLGKPAGECCEQYDCKEFTCKSAGRHYGIGEKWNLDRCTECTCVKENDKLPKAECVASSCPAPPSGKCRKLYKFDKCCPFAYDCTDTYLITVPKKMVSGHKSTFCTFVTGDNVPIDLTFILADSSVTADIKMQQTVSANDNTCIEFDVPDDIGRLATLTISGKVGQTEVSEEGKITIFISKHWTFVQTDKFYYMPGQLIQLRILTINTVKAEVSYEDLPGVWIESPSGSRIIQHLDVPNPTGLVQLDFQLAEELEEGPYTIKVETEGSKKPTTQKIKVQSYVLARFSVILSIQGVMMSAKDIPFKVCAKYTYGKAVSGKALISFLDRATILATRESVLDANGCWEDKMDTSKFNSKYIYWLRATASVTEEGTDSQVNTTQTVSLYYSKFNVVRLNMPDYFGSHLPAYIKLKIQRFDGASVEGEVMSICSLKTCKEIILDVNGIMDVWIPPHLLKDGIEVKAVNDVKEKGPMGSIYPFTWYDYLEEYPSESKSSLHFETSQEKLNCKPESKEIVLQVFYVANKTTEALLRTQLVIKSRIVWTDVKSVPLKTNDLLIDNSKLLEPMQELDPGLTRGSFELKIPTDKRSPLDDELHVSIWYARDDGEVVIASGKLDFKQCFLNPTNLSITSSNDPPAPKDTGSYTIAAAPNSVCGLGVFDRSVEILSREQRNRLTPSRFFDLLKGANPLPYENVQEDYRTCYSKRSIPDIDDDVDGSRSSPPGYYYGRSPDALKLFNDAGLLVFTDLTVENKPCSYFPDYEYAYVDEGVPIMPVQAKPHPESANSAGSDSDDDDNSDTSDVESEDKARTYFPETWLWDIVTLDVEGKHTEPVTLPDTITEWVGEALCVHPTSGVGISDYATITTFTPFFLDVKLPPFARQGEKIHVLVSVFNYLEQKLSVKVILQDSVNFTSQPADNRVCIDPNNKGVAEFVVTPSQVGNNNLTFSATVDKEDTVCANAVAIEKSDTVIRPLKVDFEGVEEEITFVDYICAGESQSPEVWSVVTPSGIVKNSERISVTATGDLMGPTLENLGHLITMPYGCGEQNMISFAPNIFVLMYLEAIGEATEAIKKEATRFMTAGYQKQLTYQHGDGSYSAFGPNDPEGSTVLTAFVLKCLSLAAKYIQVDDKDLSKSTSWLQNLQDEDGCFIKKGTVFSKSLKGGLDGASSNIPLTAYVLISLLESGGLAKDSSAVTDAKKCLTSSSQVDLYTKALIAYALALASDSGATALIDDLYNKLSNQENVKTPAVVETLAYTILAMMKVNKDLYKSKAAELIRILNMNRNSQGGFFSSQDTVLALQATEEFLKENIILDANLNVQLTSGDEKHEFIITQENRLLTQRQDVRLSPPFDISRTTTGEGCALVMLVQRYNMPEIAQNNVFSLSVKVNKETDIKYVLEICSSYLLEDGESNMAMLEVKLETGFVPDSEDLKDLVTKGVIKRFEEKDGILSLYLDEIKSSEICLSFKILREIVVDECSPGTVKVYDYYEPGQFNVKKFKTGAC